MPGNKDPDATSNQSEERMPIDWLTDDYSTIRTEVCQLARLWLGSTSTPVDHIPLDPEDLFHAVVVQFLTADKSKCRHPMNKERLIGILCEYVKYACRDLRRARRRRKDFFDKLSDESAT